MIDENPGVVQFISSVDAVEGLIQVSELRQTRSGLWRSTASDNVRTFRHWGTLSPRHYGTDKYNTEVSWCQTVPVRNSRSARKAAGNQTRLQIGAHETKYWLLINLWPIT